MSARIGALIVVALLLPLAAAQPDGGSPPDCEGSGRISGVIHVTSNDVNVSRLLVQIYLETGCKQALRITDARAGDTRNVTALRSPEGMSFAFEGLTTTRGNYNVHLFNDINDDSESGQNETLGAKQGIPAGANDVRFDVPENMGSGCGGPGQPGCGGCEGPSCQSGCQDPRGCGPQGPSCTGEGERGLAPSLEILPTIASSRSGPSQAILVTGVRNDVILQAYNPAKLAFKGRAELFAQGTAFNQSAFELDLAPGARQRFHLSITPGGENGGFGGSTLVNGTLGGTEVCEQNGLNAQSAPPVSLDWVTPAPNRALARISSIYLPAGGRVRTEGDVAFGAIASIQVRVTNHANVTSLPFFLLARVNQRALGEGVPVPALAAGASRIIDVGAIPPRATDCSGGNPACARGLDIEIGWATRIDEQAREQRASPTLSFALDERGAVSSPRFMTIHVADPGVVEPLVEAPATAIIGKPYLLTLNVTNFGKTVSKDDPVILVFVPPFRASYDVQGEESQAFVVTTSPGESVTRSAVFTPRISGRWEILAAMPEGGVCCRSNRFTFDVPGTVDVGVPYLKVPLVPLGETARTPIRVGTAAALTDVTLRITTGPAGEIRERSIAAPQGVLSGLTRTLVSADPTTIELGDIPAGGFVWSNATVTAIGSGVYNLVPYVVSGGFAYTGTPAPEEEREGEERPEFTAQYTVAFAANVVPLALAYAPAAAVAFAAIALFVGRRLWVK